GGLTPLARARLATSSRICEANFGVLTRHENGLFEPVAVVGAPPSLVDFQRQRGPFVPQAGGVLDRLLQAKKVVHSIDLSAEQIRSAAARPGGAWTHAARPHPQEGGLVGALT